MKVVQWIVFAFLSFGVNVRALQVASEYDHAACEEFQLAKELRVYKDPSIFVGNLGQMYNDPRQGWATLMNETPVLTTLEGTVHLMKLASASEFKNFGVISRLYEFADPRFKARDKSNAVLKGKSAARPMVVPVKICGTSYSDSIGFVFLSDLDKAMQEERDPKVMPPSVYPNPIPILKKQ